MEGSDLMAIPPNDKHRAFEGDTMGCRDEVEGSARDADEEREFNGMVSVDEVAASGARYTLKDVRRLYKDKAS